MEQINYAKEIIAKKRPLTHIPITKVWPWCCCKKTRPNFKLALKKSLLNKLDMKIPKSDINLEKDPFLQLGYGINAYFDIISSITWMFCFMSLVLIPSMVIFCKYGGLKEYSKMYALDQFTLGNMGGSSVLCKNFPLAVDKVQLSLSCASGKMSTTAPAFNAVDDTPIFTYGIINSSQDQKNYCQRSAFEDSYSCTSYIDPSFATAITNQCNGQSMCNLGDLPSYVNT